MNKLQADYETGLSAFHFLISDISLPGFVFLKLDFLGHSVLKHLIGFRDSPQAGKPTGFCCVVLQAATSSECEEIVNRIGECETTSVDVIKGFICQASITLEIIHIFSPLQLLGSNIQNGLYEKPRT